MCLQFQAKLIKLRPSSLETTPLTSLQRTSLRFALQTQALKTSTSKAKARFNYHSTWWSFSMSSSTRRFRMPLTPSEAGSNRHQKVLSHLLVLSTKSTMKVYQTRTSTNTTRRTMRNNEKQSCWRRLCATLLEIKSTRWYRSCSTSTRMVCQKKYWTWFVKRSKACSKAKSRCFCKVPSWQTKISGSKYYRFRSQTMNSTSS